MVGQKDGANVHFSEHLESHRSRGVYPPTTMALPPFSRLPPLFRHPSPPTPLSQIIFGHFIRNFVQFYAFYFSEFWKMIEGQKHQNTIKFKRGW